jgi:hypothetical protein
MMTYAKSIGPMVAAALLTACSGTGGTLHLEKEGSFFVNGRTIRTQYPGASLVTGPAPPGHITVGQMYVQYRVPVGASGIPIVMVHGSARPTRPRLTGEKGGRLTSCDAVFPSTW